MDAEQAWSTPVGWRNTRSPLHTCSSRPHSAELQQATRSANARGNEECLFGEFGVELRHSVNAQARVGKIVSPEDARPGDVVIFNDHSHNGIYAGNGQFYHAPQPGDRVKLAPIFDPRYYFIRLGTDS